MEDRVGAWCLCGINPAGWGTPHPAAVSSECPVAESVVVVVAAQRQRVDVGVPAFHPVVQVHDFAADRGDVAAGVHPTLVDGGEQQPLRHAGQSAGPSDQSGAPSVSNTIGTTLAWAAIRITSWIGNCPPWAVDTSPDRRSRSSSRRSAAASRASRLVRGGSRRRGGFRGGPDRVVHLLGAAAPVPLVLGVVGAARGSRVAWRRAPVWGSRRPVTGTCRAGLAGRW